jgi:hypothetical protein
VKPALAVVQDEFVLLGLGSRQAPTVDPVRVPAAPVRDDQDFIDPVRGGGRQRVQCRADGLADQFEAVQIADGGHDVGGVGALPAARRDQALRAQRFQQQVQDLSSSWCSTTRVRNSDSTEWSKPGSSNCRPRVYFQARFSRTSSAACRSVRLRPSAER